MSTALIPVTNGNGNDPVVVVPNANHRIRLEPNQDYKEEDYEDICMEFNPLLYNSLERFLPPDLVNASLDTKYEYIRNILRRFSNEEERTRDKKNQEYRQKIISSYQPLHKDLYTLNPTAFFVPNFLKAVSFNDNSREESIRSIISEPVPGVYVFDMLQQSFCEKLISEVQNFEKWVHETKFRIMRPNTMNKFGAVLDDFGMHTMLEKMMKEFILPISTIFFLDVGGNSLNSHHGFVVEYGIDKEADMGIHVDDAEVTLNVCLGKDFTGGNLFLRGVRCEEHVNSDTLPEEVFEYAHIPGRAILHHGHHRHGARATTSGTRANLVLWCRSKAFRILKSRTKNFTDWCGVCNRKEQERVHQNHENFRKGHIPSDEVLASSNLN